MAKWSTSDTGILRKKVVPENHDDLLVFGYACKLFRDDEKAKYIDQGKHLIPWMGEEALKIDRYDCRGALSDLSCYEASREGYDAMRWLGLSESERKIEQLCDEERYYSLNTNEEEEEMYKEEEMKRLQQKTNEFAYSYDVQQNPQTSQEVGPPTCIEEDREYIPKPELNVPADIAIPKTEKENARIEKTALFVSKQGPQMEILIKTKQANNPQFSFLNQSDPLYKYYKHVLNAVKSGTYVIEPKQEEEKQDAVEQESNEEHYLHPSLLTQTSVQETPTYSTTIPTVTYKSTADCAYSQLVNRIQGNSQADDSLNKSETERNPLDQNQLTYEQQQQQYYQYYYAMQYYEYYKQLHGLGGSDGQTMTPLMQEQLNSQATAFAQMAYAQYVQRNATTNPYSQLVSNLSQTKDSIYPILPPNPPETEPIEDITKAPVIYGRSEGEKSPAVRSATPPVEIAPPKIEEQPKKPVKTADVDVEKPVLSLVHYDSDSEEETVEKEPEKPKVPPEETRQIIDKMASYVSKNGGDFENIVRSKADDRFDFLKDDHEYNPYYKSKLKEYSSGSSADVRTVQRTVRNGVSQKQEQSQSKTKDKKIITPVSFSIKKPKEEVTKDIKSALPLEESDDDEPADETPAVTKEVTIKPREQKLLPSTPTLTLNSTKEVTFGEVEEPQIAKDSPDKKLQRPAIEGDDPILEMIDLTEDLEERKDARRAEDRIKDKLAAAARERLASASKDRALQMERKKKAAAFLKLKSVGTVAKNEEKPNEEKVLVISDGDNNEKGRSRRRSRSGTRESCAKKDDSGSEEGEIKKHRKNKKKKSHHKRKRSRSRHKSRTRYKKAKKRRRRSQSCHESSSSDD